MKKQVGMSKTAIISLLIVLSILSFIVYGIVADPWDVSKAPYGAGDYYYTDVEGFDFSKKLGTNHPFLFFGIFFGWSVGCWYFLKWLESRN
ncbi:MAG: hypothetical protein ACOYVD_07065 [Bacillota bacterium]